MKMKYVLALSLSSLLILPLTNYTTVYAEEDTVIMEQITSDGSIRVRLIWPEIRPEVIYDINLQFLHPTSEILITDPVRYNVEVTQEDHLIERFRGQITNNGRGFFEVMFPEGGTGHAEVEVTITAIGQRSADRDLPVVFDVMVVPEFPAMLALAMAASFGIFILLARMKKNQMLSYRPSGSELG